ncbi:DUF2933 domain-containing protein [Alcaligenaceae bacterium]|nr:DUF2933 domain-containing protein [Alcaligenaceae bacterium]
MKLDIKKMLVAGLGLTAMVAVGYVALPTAHEPILAMSPLLFLLLSSLLMFFMMKNMQSNYMSSEIQKSGSAPLPTPVAVRIKENSYSIDHSKEI